MATNESLTHERTPLLKPDDVVQCRRLSQMQHDEISSILSSHLSKSEIALGNSAIGERLPYNDYTTIDWMHDLVKGSYRYRAIHSGKSLRLKLLAYFDSCSGWIAAALIGTLTACVAFCVDVAEATVSDWKLGYCSSNPLLDREACCRKELSVPVDGEFESCTLWHSWSENYWALFAIYGGMALAFGIISASVTTFTKKALPAAPVKETNSHPINGKPPENVPSGKSLYMAAGSGIPEIKTILSGFVIPHFLDLKVLIVKAVGATFAVATGMCLGKEGPFVHISGCVGYLVASLFPKYRNNGRMMRQMLSAAVAAGLSVAFGAPIGGVLFSYEEISTYFPRKVLWRAFLCSMCAAITLRELNPTGTGKLVLFETNYGTSYHAIDYFVFVLLGICGGIWGGTFCQMNFRWGKWFRSFKVIKNNTVLEVFLVVLVTVLLQYPNPMTREPGDIIIKNLLVNCEDGASKYFVCQAEGDEESRLRYVGLLVYGCLTKLVLTIITFGCKVPSGVIIPALDAGAFFGRLVGQFIGTMSPGIYAMVGAAAFLAGVSRMTISLCVVMFELTGELEYVLPHMIAILVAKWVADSLSEEGVYDLAQTVLGHPFLDLDNSTQLVQSQSTPHLVGRLIPPKQTMDEITVFVGKDNKVPRSILEHKLSQLHARGLMDAGLVLVQNGIAQGYLAQGELEFGLRELTKFTRPESRVRLLGQPIEERPDYSARSTPINADEEHLVDHVDQDDDLDLSPFVDRTPLTMCESSPMEYAMECFAKLGLRHLLVTEEGTGRLKGVIIKKRLVQYIETLHDKKHS